MTTWTLPHELLYLIRDPENGRSPVSANPTHLTLAAALVEAELGGFVGLHERRARRTRVGPSGVGVIDQVLRKLDDPDGSVLITSLITAKDWTMHRETLPDRLVLDDLVRDGHLLTEPTGTFQRSRYRPSSPARRETLLAEIVRPLREGTPVDRRQAERIALLDTFHLLGGVIDEPVLGRVLDRLRPLRRQASASGEIRAALAERELV
ncbi:hypothetical protein ABIB25_001681 [Nakamurella sp. UYEF19]|uniref:GPP34 family phosphoprotein n=1 Tax=Nakamurella sp. UYEF19 TaxID=1756392 RepID=UPI003390C47B